MELLPVVFFVLTAALLVRDSECRPVGTDPPGKVQQWILDNPSHSETPNIETAFNYLVQYGYSKVSPQNMNWQAFSNALKRYQKRMDIPQTGEPDSTTLEKMAEPRCGLPDETGGIDHDGHDIVKRYDLREITWNKLHLTYKITQYTAQLTEVQQRESVVAAFKSWSDVTPLTFTPTLCGDVDIEIKFVPTNNHGDTAFGTNTLAHGFYPGVLLDTSLAGDVHMNDQFSWTIALNTNYNVQAVFVHEFGHSLGLRHTVVSGAVMAPIYAHVMSLQQDDIDGIHAQYGPELVDTQQLEESCIDRSNGYPPAPIRVRAYCCRKKKIFGKRICVKICFENL